MKSALEDNQQAAVELAVTKQSRRRCVVVWPRASRLRQGAARDRVGRRARSATIQRADTCYVTSSHDRGPCNGSVAVVVAAGVAHVGVEQDATRRSAEQSAPARPGERALGSQSQTCRSAFSSCLPLVIVDSQASGSKSANRSRMEDGFGVVSAETRQPEPGRKSSPRITSRLAAITRKVREQSY